jgi:hypothetical protein
MKGTLQEVCLLVGRVLVMPAKLFIHSKLTYGYDVKNMST